MQDLALWNLALQAFAAVLVVLAALAGAVMVLTRAFGRAPFGPTGRRGAPSAAAAASPHASASGGARSGMPSGPPSEATPGSPHAPGTPPDPFVMAAIHAAVRHLAPGAEVTRVDEVT